MSGTPTIWQDGGVNSTADDQALLTRFVDGSDDRAFTQVIERYGGLVYHTAYRITQQAQLAEEAAQGVFISLARKAERLRKREGSLAPWLYRVAVLEARAIHRRERRHERKRKALQEAMNQEPESTPLTNEALDTLDRALSDLSRTETQFLFHRFFEGHSFQEMAAITGKTEAACQKQCQRLLQKLAQSLQKRGVTVAAGVLALGLSTEFAKGAPDGFVSELSFLPPRSGWLGSLSMANLCLIIGVLLVIGHGIANQVLASRFEIAEPAESRVEAPASLLSARRSAASSPVLVGLVSFRQAMEACLDRPDLLRPRLGFRQRLYALDPNDLPEAAEMVATSRMARMDGLCREVFQRWAREDLDAALARSIHLINELGPGWDDGHELVTLEAVIDTMDTLSPHNMHELVNGLPVGIRNGFFAWGIDKLAKENPASAVDYLDTLTEPWKRVRALEAVVSGWGEESPRQALAWASKLSNDHERSKAVDRVMRIYARGDAKEALEASSTLTEPRMRNKAAVQALDSLASKDFNQAISWAQAHRDDPSLMRLLAPVLGKHATDLPTTELIAQSETFQAIGDQQNYLFEAAVRRGRDPDQALELISQISDESSRIMVLDRFLTSMQSRGDLEREVRKRYSQLAKERR